MLKKLLIALGILFSASGQAQELFCVDSIAFRGDYRTKKSILIRELNFAEGDCLALDSLPSILNLAEKRIFNTQLFNHVKAENLLLKDKHVIVFTVDERFPIFPKPNLEFADRNFNVWWNEQGRKLNRLNIGLDLIHQNVAGRREQLTVGGQIGYTKMFQLAYSIPYLDRQKKHGLGASISWLNNMEMPYITDSNKLLFKRFEHQAALEQFSAGLSYRFRPKFATTHSFSIAFRHISVNDSISNFYNPNYLGNGKSSTDVLSFNYRIDYNGVDNWNYPLEGFRIIGILNTDYQMGQRLLPSVHWQADWYQKISPKILYSLITRGRKAFGTSLPYFLQKNMGYDFDEMRGYEYYVNDGTFFTINRANLKYELINKQIKLPIRYFRYIPIRVYAKTYSDLGYTYSQNKGNNVLNNQLLYSYGFGLDIVTLYDIRIRLEYTMNKNGEHGLYLHKSGE